MALFMDVHTLPAGATAAYVARAHEADLQAQSRFGVDWRHYWVSEQDGRAFCLVEAPSADAARQCHQEAHGLLPDEIFEVAQG